MKHMQLKIEGRVQGVGYRWSAQNKAQELELAGWVRNQPDGTVLLEAEGEEAALHALRRWCEEGPPGARVSRVVDAYREAGGDLPRPFRIGR